MANKKWIAGLILLSGCMPSPEWENGVLEVCPSRDIPYREIVHVGAKFDDALNGKFEAQVKTLSDVMIGPGMTCGNARALRMRETYNPYSLAPQYDLAMKLAKGEELEISDCAWVEAWPLNAQYGCPVTIIGRVASGFGNAGTPAPVPPSVVEPDFNPQTAPSPQPPPPGPTGMIEICRDKRYFSVNDRKPAYIHAGSDFLQYYEGRIGGGEGAGKYTLESFAGWRVQTLEDVTLRPKSSCRHVRAVIDRTNSTPDAAPPDRPDKAPPLKRGVMLEAAYGDGSDNVRARVMSGFDQ